MAETQSYSVFQINPCRKHFIVYSHIYSLIVLVMISVQLTFDKNVEEFQFQRHRFDHTIANWN